MFPRQEGVCEELCGGLEGHLEVRGPMRLDSSTVHGLVATALGHVVSDEVEVADVDSDTVRREHIPQLADNAGAGGLHPVGAEDSRDVVGR